MLSLGSFGKADLEKLWPRVIFDSYESKADNADDNSSVESTEQVASYEVLSRGSKGDNVKRLQQSLIDQGFLSGKADGDFGNMTAEAVKKAQKAFGMDQTGIADDAFQKKLFG